MTEPTIERAKKESSQGFKATAGRIGGCFLYVVVMLAGFYLLAVLVHGAGWVSEKVYPWALLFAAIALFLVTPIGFLLSIFRISRGVGSVALLIASYVIGFSLWLWALLVAYTLAGAFWMIVGLIFAGVGVVPVAFFAALFSRQWAVAGQLLLMTVVVYAIRAASLSIARRTGPSHDNIQPPNQKKGVHSILWKMFPPYEVKLTVEEVKAFFDARPDCLSRSVVEPQVLSLAKVAEKTVYSIRIDRRKPDEVALVLITNVVGRHLGTGQYHIYRGVLGGMGNDMLNLWHDAQTELLDRGYSTDAEVEEDNEWLREQIGGAG